MAKALTRLKVQHQLSKFNNAMRRRLNDIGLIPGTRVECLGRSPGGDPSAYLIRGAVIALRRSDSQNILIAPH